MWNLRSSIACSTLVLLGAFCAGCGEKSQQPSERSAEASEPERQDGMTAVEIMQKVVAVYREADSYMDNAEYAEHFIRPTDGVMRQTAPTTLSVRLQRPNRFLITHMRTIIDAPPQGAIVASDGSRLEAVVTNLAPQRLRVDAPEVATLQTVAPDPILREALFPGPIPDIFPQLALLLPDGEKAPWPLEDPRALVLLPPKKIKTPSQDAIDCYRVQLRTDEGPQVMWIHKETFVFLRIEIANEKIQKHLYPDQEFTEFTWQFNFFDVAVDITTSKDMFRLPSLEGQDEEEMVDAFRQPPAEPEGEANPPEATEGAEQPADSEPSTDEAEQQEE